ncbi:uncharacterized protein LTR77_003445 [Saxophila tyrrhenica]|uniref:Secreted protein n=1 Tax=Saxophila tyrrhenica TaxID=1690608 RepID=A0AAV9PH26_9PEZI|nr:hypothetical protein LTR77_003445 [Saxophila tyrrhenica]
MLFFQTAVCAILLATSPLVESSPIFKRTSLLGGSLRPAELITRSLDILSVERRQTSSTDTDCGLLGCTGAGAASGNETSASSSSSCQFLGGCSSGAGSSCQTEKNDVGNTSSSVCGSSTSTDSSGFLGLGDLSASSSG